LKILVISNLFPPYKLGGYEQRCFDVCNYLSLNGHQITVVTSDYEIKNKNISYNHQLKIYRALDLHWFSSPKNFLELNYSEWKNFNFLRNLISKLGPELIYVWSCRGLPSSIFSVINFYNKYKKIPVVIDISDKWLLELTNSRWFQYWKDKSDRSRTKRNIKIHIENIISKFLPTTIRKLFSEYVYYTSNDLKELYKNNGFNVEKSPVFRPFVSTEFFSGKIRKPVNNARFKMVYLGRITEAKGVITIVEAMMILKEKGISVELSIFGKSDLEPEYLKRLLSLINKGGLIDRITLKDQVPRESVPNIITNHNVTICPSIGHEAFMTIPLESMASNVPVIATPVGGNKEYLKHEKNCLLFYPGNANDLANCISRLIYDDELYNHIQKVGYQLVEKDYTINKIIPKIEKYIIDAKIIFFNSC